MSGRRTGSRAAAIPAIAQRAALGAIALRSAFAAMAIVLAFAANASATEFRAELDRTSVPVGGQLSLRLILSGDGRNLPRLRPPVIDGFDSYSAGTSQNIAIVGGQVQASVTQTFVLLAKREGTFTVGPFELTHDGHKMTTDSFTVKVVAAGNEPVAPSRGSSGRQSQNGARPLDFFVRAEADKREAYVNEQVTLTFKFYSRVRLSKDPEYSPPTATGFWVEDLPPVRQYTEDVDGAQYLVNEVKSALFPTTAGDLTIGPATVKVTRSAADNWRLRDPFQVFGQDPFAVLDNGKPEVLTTKPLRLRVKPLPAEGKPEGFSGLVGQYTLTSRIDKQSVEANQPVTITLVLAGDGNLSTAPEPALKLPQGVRSYDSQSRVNTNKEGYRLRGEKIVEKVLIPQVPGRLAIPSAVVVVFDPKKGAYRAVASDSLSVNVTPSSAPIAAAGGDRAVRRVGRDVREIREGAGVLAPRKRWLYEQPAFWVMQALPLGVFVAARQVGRARRLLERDEGLARSRRARGVAHRRLREAQRALTTGTGGDFFALLGRSMTDFTSDKLGLSRHGIPQDELLETLRARGASDELVTRLRRLLERCDMGRFAPGGGSAGERAELLSSGEAIIGELERLLRA